MANSANPEMIALARESRGLSQTELSTAIGVSQAKVSKYESGLLKVSDDDLANIAETLDFPKEFFCQSDNVYGFGSSCFYHRKRRRMSVGELRIIQAKINIFRFHVVRLLQSVDVEAENQFLRLDAEDNGGPEAIARLIRQQWGLKMGPVQDVIGAIENAGGIIYVWSFGTQNLDAISHIAPNCPPIIFANADIPGDRLRFTLMHEVGHIIMHRVPTDDMEKEADQFASEFLMPAKEVKTSLRKLSLNRLPALKSEWKVSMAALIKRSFDLDQITERHYRTLFTQMSTNGWRTREPIHVPVEKPRVFRNIVDAHLNELNYTPFELSKKLAANEHRVRRYFEDAPVENGPLRVVG